LEKIVSDETAVHSKTHGETFGVAHLNARMNIIGGRQS
jgi:hypothetical protein